MRESPILGHFKIICLRVTFPLRNLSKHSLRQWSKEGGEQFDRQAIAQLVGFPPFKILKHGGEGPAFVTKFIASYITF